MILSFIASLLIQPVELPSGEAEMSRLLQHSCQVQQVNNNGRGEPADYAPFCGCMDSSIMAEGGSAIHRIFAFGGQGAIQQQSLLPDWEQARSTAQSEAAALPAEEQARFGEILQGALGTCLSLMPMGE